MQEIANTNCEVKGTPVATETAIATKIDIFVMYDLKVLLNKRRLVARVVCWISRLQDFFFIFFSQKNSYFLASWVSFMKGFSQVYILIAWIPPTMSFIRRIL
jgi:hypothetical protein